MEFQFLRESLVRAEIAHIDKKGELVRGKRASRRQKRSMAQTYTVTWKDAETHKETTLPIAAYGLGRKVRLVCAACGYFGGGVLGSLSLGTLPVCFRGRGQQKAGRSSCGPQRVSERRRGSARLANGSSLADGVLKLEKVGVLTARQRSFFCSAGIVHGWATSRATATSSSTHYLCRERVT